MKLEELEAIYEASKPYFNNPMKRDMRTLSEKFAFEAAFHEMAPKMIKALKAVKSELSADGDFEEMWPLSAAAFIELEQP
jgi:hypothetical protein